MRPIRILIAAALVAAGLIVVAAPAQATGISINTTQWAFGSQLLPQPGDPPLPGTPKDFIVTNTGPEVTAQTADPTFQYNNPNDAGSFDVTANTCKGATIPTGGTCTLTIVAHPVTVGPHAGTTVLNLTPTAAWQLSLSVYGQTTPAVAAEPGPGMIHFVWNQLPQGPIDNPLTYTLTVLRGTDPAHMSAVVTGIPPFAVDGGGATSGTGYRDSTVVPGTRYYYQVEEVTGPTVALVYPPSPVSAMAWPKGGAGAYYPLNRPVRFLDTRLGTGAPRARLASGHSIHVQITGRGGVPTAHVSAVVVNVTALRPDAQTSLTAFATGTIRPPGQTLWVNAGQTLDDNVTVRIGSGGKIDIYNGQATTDVIVDVYGYYTSDAALVSQIGNGAQWHLYDYAPDRVLDSRQITNGALHPGQFYSVEIPMAEFARLHVRGVAVSITTVNATGSGALSAYSTGALANPSTLSTIRFAHGLTTQNLAIVPTKNIQVNSSTPTEPYIAIANTSTQTTDLVVDVVAFYDDDTLPFSARYVPFAPRMIADSSKNLGFGNLGSNQTATVSPGTAALPITWAVGMTVTAVRPTSNTSVGVWPNLSVADGGPIATPVTGRVQAHRGWITSSSVMPVTGTGNVMNVLNAAGSMSLRVELDGRFDLSTTYEPDEFYDPTFPPTATALAAARAVALQHAIQAYGRSAGRVHVQLGGLSAQPDATVLH